MFDLQQERISIFHDVYDNKIPERIPVSLSLSFEATAQFGEFDLREVQWTPALIARAVEKVCNTLYSDICPASFVSLRYPAYYEILRSQSFRMGASGFMQHPEVIGMLEDDYDYLIDKPYDCLLERVIPRQFKALSTDNPVQKAITLAKAVMAKQADISEGILAGKQFAQKYGYYPGNVPGADSMTEAPFDFLSDQLRSFKGAMMDVRRMPDKVAAACESLTPLVFKLGIPSVINHYSRVIYPLHMPTFMREKDFEKLWWPSFKRICDKYASLGIGNQLWCEGNWMRYLDYLYDLPANTVLIFEYGDPKIIKEKLGKKHIITGLYPLTMLKTHTAEQCIDKAKEMLDTLAPGGKYIFGLDKIPITSNSFNMENLAAVAEYVRDNGRYNNSGETAGMFFNQSDYQADTLHGFNFESKYFKTWDQYRSLTPGTLSWGENKLQNLEERMFGFFMMLLI